MPISTIGQNGLNAPLSLTSPTIATPTFTGQPANVVAICNAAWTEEVVSAYQAQVAAQQV